MKVTRPFVAFSILAVALMGCDLDGKVRHRDGPQTSHPGDVVRASQSASFAAPASETLSAESLAELTVTTDLGAQNAPVPEIQ